MKRIVFIIVICFTCNSAYSQNDADTNKQLINLVIESMRHDTDIINDVYDGFVSYKRNYNRAPQRFLSKYINESGIHFSGYTSILNRLDYKQYSHVDSRKIHNSTLPETKRKIFAQIIKFENNPEQITVYITFNESPPKQIIASMFGGYIGYTYEIKDGILQKDGGYLIGF